MPHIQTSGKHLEYSALLLHVLVSYIGKSQEMTAAVCGKGRGVVYDVGGNILKVASSLKDALVKL